MWRMRMRLLFGFVVLLALGHLPQERGVLAQKYYMNFAFNNNNPDGDGGGGGKGGPPYKGATNEGGPQEGQSETESSKEIQENAVWANMTNTDGGGNGTEDAGKGEKGDGGDGGDGAGYQGADGMGNGNGQVPTGGTDNDNDDSDSKDAKNRHRKQAEQEDNGHKRKDHSHHSSYEISIDDSFGGRYVRSIYESSESHGHSGSNAGSNARDSKGESSQEGMDDTKTKSTDDTENPNNGAVGGDIKDGQDDDYEEM